MPFGTQATRTADQSPPQSDSRMRCMAVITARFVVEIFMWILLPIDAARKARVLPALSNATRAHLVVPAFSFARAWLQPNAVHISSIRTARVSYGFRQASLGRAAQSHSRRPASSVRSK